MSFRCSACGGILTDSDRFCPACGTARNAGVDVEAPTEPASAWDRVLAQLREATAGEYVIVRQIGRGGMAAVFLAVDIALNRNVAIKVLSPAMLMAEGMAERFRDEAITIARLDHPNIIAIHGVRRRDDLHFFIMKYVEGRPLDYIIRNEGPLGVPMVQGIVAQVAPALSYAHRHGVIHRDVKPANLLVERTGRIIVSDFGIAKVAESPGLTQTGSMIGTATYMSPEQCAGTPATRSSDQYSLAIVIYELLAGRPPHSGPPLEIMHAHVYSEIPPLRSRRPDCTPQFERALHRMLVKDPSGRWASLEDAQVALGADPRANTEDFRAKLASLAAPDADVTKVLSAASPNRRTTQGSRGVRSSGPAKIVIQNAPDELETGERASVAGLVVDARGTTLEHELDWASTSPDVVAIEGNPPTLTGIGPGTARIRASVRGAGVSADVGITVVDARTHTLELSATMLTLEPGGRSRLSAVPRDRRGMPLAQEVHWSSADPAIAGVSTDGVVTGHAPGTTELTATAGDARRYATVTVEPARVATIRVSPAEASVMTGDAIRIEAMPCDVRGAGLSDRMMTWTSRSPTIASITADGVVTGWTRGGAEIVVECEGASATVLVTVDAPPLAHLEVQGVPDEITPGRRFRLSAFAVNVRGERVPVDVTWRSERSRFASVSRDGVVEARRPGEAAITARSSGLESRVELRVLSSPAVATGVSPRPTQKRRIASVALAGLALVAVSVITAKIVATMREPVDPVAVEGGEPIETGDAGQEGNSGPVPTNPGNAKGVEGEGQGIVVLVLDSPVRVITVGDSILIDAEFRGTNDGASARSLTWSSSNSLVATVSATGLVRAIAPGTVQIRARTPLIGDSIALRVLTRRIDVSTIAITPPGTRMIAGEVATLRAQPQDADGRPLNGRSVNWTSSDRSIATVDAQTGQVTGLKPGVASITAESESARASVILTVAEPPAPPADPREETANREPEPARFTALSAGGGTCGTATDDRVLCWGFGAAGVQADGNGFDAVAAGWNHRCGLRTGAAFCWGANDHGQLGDGGTTSRGSPTAVAGDIRFTEIATGQFHSCGLDTQGAAYCWGENDAGQLGTGSTRDSGVPVRVEASVAFVAITTGRAHTCAIERGGRAWCWGDGLAGEIGNGMTQNQSKPFPLSNDYRFRDIAAGDDFTCALTEAGKAMCWGNNRDSQLGDTRNRLRDEPREVARIPGFQMITTGRHHACGLGTDGRIHCWGSNLQGQLGTGTTSSASAPSPVESPLRFKAVSAGNLHTCALADTGIVYCWGDNSHGQIDAGGSAFHTTPVTIRIPG